MAYDSRSKVPIWFSYNFIQLLTRLCCPQVSITPDSRRTVFAHIRLYSTSEIVFTLKACGPTVHCWIKTMDNKQMFKVGDSICQAAMAFHPW